jgi:tRNA dimethylallyltransferase
MSMDIVCLVGATGAGKTASSLHLCRCFHGEVVNFDSRQVYRDIPLVTAQPSAREQAVCPHHLYGYLASDIPVQAGRFVETVRRTLEEITARGNLPVLVGGTGLYLKTLIQGIAATHRVLVCPTGQPGPAPPTGTSGSCVCGQDPSQ